MMEGTLRAFRKKKIGFASILLHNLDVSDSHWKWRQYTLFLTLQLAENADSWWWWCSVSNLRSNRRRIKESPMLVKESERLRLLLFSQSPECSLRCYQGRERGRRFWWWQWVFCVHESCYWEWKDQKHSGQIL